MAWHDVARWSAASCWRACPPTSSVPDSPRNRGAIFAACDLSMSQFYAENLPFTTHNVSMPQSYAGRLPIITRNKFTPCIDTVFLGGKAGLRRAQCIYTAFLCRKLALQRGSTAPPHAFAPWTPPRKSPAKPRGNLRTGPSYRIPHRAARRASSYQYFAGFRRARQKAPCRCGYGLRQVR